MAFFLVTNSFAELVFESWKQVKGDVRGREFFLLGMGDVVSEAAVGRGSRSGNRCVAAGERGGVAARQHARCDGLGVAFDAGELAGDHDAGMGLELEGFGEQAGGVDVGVAMNLTVAQEGCAFEAGDEAEDAGLLAILEVVLEADEVVAVGAEVLLAKLHDGVGPAAGLRVGEADGLHGAEAEGVAAAASGLFDGKAAFEVLKFFGGGGYGRFR